MEEAISSAGGVCWSGLDATLMVKALPGVFVAGEMIDWEAPTGGYLMQGCFATGTRAGLAAAAWVDYPPQDDRRTPPRNREPTLEFSPPPPPVEPPLKAVGHRVNGWAAVAPSRDCADAERWPPVSGSPGHRCKRRRDPDLFPSRGFSFWAHPALRGGRCRVTHGRMGIADRDYHRQPTTWGRRLHVAAHAGREVAC